MRKMKVNESDIVFQPNPTARNFIDLKGMVFERLTVIGFAGRRGSTKVLMWFCRCQCGEFIKTYGRSLRSGACRSCGCLAEEASAARLLVHGDSRVKSTHYLYHIRINIIGRCCNPANPIYKYYGGRGITICEEWRNSHAAFRDYVLKNLGERPEKHHLDRIDNERGYEPGNLRWVTPRENTLNRRNTSFLTIRGVKKPLSEWARIAGVVPRKRVEARIKAGWSPEEAVFSKKHRRTAVSNVVAPE